MVKTASGKQSGVTHAGGRYVHRGNPYRIEVMRKMRELGMEPPQPPFIIAPGEYTLYHEWGHHVDRTWSGDDEEVLFSFRWFSRFYELCAQPSHIANHGSTAGCNDIRPIESDLHAAEAVVVWRHAASELFADLFEDWMRAEKKVGWDQCEPENLSLSEARGHPFLRIALLPGVRAEDVRDETYRLYAAGIRAPADLPPVRPGLLGANTDKIVDHLRGALERAKTQGL